MGDDHVHCQSSSPPPLGAWRQIGLEALVLVTLEAGEENGEKYFDLIWPAFDDQLSFYGKKYWIDNDEGRLRLKDDGDAHRLVERLYQQVLEEAAFDAAVESVQP